MDTLYEMTNDGKSYELRVDLVDKDGRKGHARYRDFNISGSSDNYRLHVGTFLGGNAGTEVKYLD